MNLPMTREAPAPVFGIETGGVGLAASLGEAGLTRQTEAVEPFSTSLHPGAPITRESL